ncbi:hypothetical protein PTTG_11737 [Puccinia triticina 1-1 BBBD Race 1]|uniref:Non-specific serine/threonine protein kinase n=1 Tax=Puccinia triticina (isolate 1-1 / race 1 (BBBD)) TaxID=630390 RepID=A0A180G7P0_PUCT1|nr:hypothetical protein PTTG_11737 [Puccinia triticina 1-1 BBBD Race 1]
MEQEPESLHNNLRNSLTSQGISTVEQFFGLDESEIKKHILSLEVKILPSDFTFFLFEYRLAMSSLAHTGYFENFKPFITVVLANEPTSNEEMLELVYEGFSAPRNGPSAWINSSASDLMMYTSSYNVCQFRSVLELQRKGVMYPDVPGLVEHFIWQHHIAPMLLLQHHESFVNQRFEEGITDPSEPVMSNWIGTLVEHCSTWLKKETPTHHHSRTWRAWPSDLKHSDGARKLHYAITSRFCRDILVPVVLNNNESDSQQADLCLVKQVSEVFIAQPTQSYAIGFTMCGTFMRLWQFDRSGAIGSESFNIIGTKENLSKFLALILLFLMSSKQVLGFDPTIIDIDGQAPINTRRTQKIQLQTQPNPQELVIDCPLYRESGICGRGTTCWQAHLSGDESEKFVIKDSWQPLEQREEGSILRDVTEKNVPHVVRYHHHETVHVASQIVDIESHLRGGINFKSGEEIRPTDASDDLQEQESKGFINRVHRRLVLKDVGQPIWTVDSPIHLLEALEGCIKGHQALLKAGYLHRDISINNLMIDNQTTDPDRKYFLIDLDGAVAYPIVNEEDRDPRYGTKVFVSFNLLLKDKPRDFVDDLESFFWVLMWICVNHPANQSKNSWMSGWKECGPMTLGSIKSGTIMNLHSRLFEFTDHYQQSQPIVDCVIEFANVMRSPDVREKDSARLYGEILDIFQKAQGKPVEGQ